MAKLEHICAQEKDYIFSRTIVVKCTILPIGVSIMLDGSFMVRQQMQRTLRIAMTGKFNILMILNISVENLE